MLKDQILKIYIALRTPKKGQAMLEYALIVGLIVAGCVVFLSPIGNKIKELFQTLSTNMGIN